MSHQPTTEQYEVLLQRLQALVERLESGAISLDEAIAAYEEGVGVAAACRQVLERAVLRVRSLQAAEPLAE